MKLRRFLLRYYPPGIILEYEQGGEMRNKPVDLLQLTPESDLEVIVNQIVRQEALISENRKPQLRKLLCPPELRRTPRGAPASRTGDTRRPSAYCTHMRRRRAACPPARPSTVRTEYAYACEPSGALHTYTVAPRFSSPPP